MENDNRINENKNHVNKKEEVHPIKNWLYIGVIIIGIIIMFRSCFGCGSSNEDNSEDKYYDSETGINYTCCSNCCAKCYAKISKENDKKALREGIKKARNKWVDDNPNEARRRGIHKF